MSTHNDHYLSLQSSPNRHAAFSLRDPVQYELYANGQPTGRFSYDPDHDAAKVTIPPGSGEIGINDYLNLGWAAVEAVKGDTACSVQWECRWGAAFLNARAFGLAFHKAFRFRHPYPVGSGRRFDVKVDYRKDADPPGTVALPEMRSYGLPDIDEGDGSSLEPLSIDGNPHPAAPSLQYIHPDRWVRFTLTVEWENDLQFVTLWMADEITDPVCLIDRFLIYNASYPEAHGLNNMQILFDTSQEPTNVEPLELWFRNVIVYKNAEVPLGGRPMDGQGEPLPEPGTGSEPEPDPEPGTGTVDPEPGTGTIEPDPPEYIEPLTISFPPITLEGNAAKVVRQAIIDHLSSQQ